MSSRPEHLYRIARAVLGASSLREVVEHALAGAAELIDAWRLSVGLIDERAATFAIYEARGRGGEHFAAGAVVPLREFGGDLRKLSRGEIDLVQDLTAPDAPEGAAGFLAGTALRGQLIVPLLDRGALLGTLDLGADVPDFFTEAHIRDAVEVAALLTEALRQVRLRQELEAAHGAALSASRSKSAFLANMSHELRTPLNAIIGYTELVGEEVAERGIDGLGSDLERIRHAADHLLTLINDVLDLAKIEAGKLDFTSVPVPLDALVEDVAAAVAPLVARRNNRWVLEVEATGAVQADPVRVRQILFNLIGNAAKFTEGGEIGLRVFRKHGSLRFAVRDTGIGIRADKLATLFEAFTQAHASQGEDFGGTGLGLSIAKRYAQRMGGDVTVDSTPGEGSVFTLRLPEARADGA